MMRQLTAIALFTAIGLSSAPAFAAESPQPPASPDVLRMEADRAQAANAIKSQMANPVVAALLSGLVPGLGQLYKGDPMRGIMVFGGAVGVFAASTLLGGLLVGTNSEPAYYSGIFIASAALPSYWAWNVTDAFYQSHITNESLSSEARTVHLSNPAVRVTLWRF